MTYDIDRRAITSIIKERDVRPFIRARITKQFFKSTSSRIAYNWIRTYHAKYNSVPTRELFREQYPNYEFAKGQLDPSEFIINALLDRHSFKILVDGIADAGQQLQDNNPRSALTKLTAMMEKARLTVNRSHDLSMADAVPLLLQQYIKRKHSPLMSGMPYGFAPLDELTDGMMEQQLGLIFGDSGVGKSWLACLFGYACFKAGYKVLHITKENADIEIAARMQCLHCHVSPFRFKTGELTTWEEKKLGRLSGRMRRMGNRYVIVSQDDETEDVGSGSEAVRQKIIQYKPDLVIVDGLYLMTDDDLTGPEWQTMRKMAYRMKRIAKKESVFVLAVTQASSGSETGATDQIAFSKGIKTACDVVINIRTNEELDGLGLHEVELVKQREGPQNKKFAITWDFDTPQFIPVDLETEAETEEKAELPV